MKGTYSLQEAEKTIQLKYGNFGNLKFNTLSAQVVVTDSQLSLLFNADKLLDFLGKLSSISDNATLKAVNTLAEQYDGMKVTVRDDFSTWNGVNSKFKLKEITTGSYNSKKNPEHQHRLQLSN